MIKLGVPVKDKFTGLNGMLTHYQIFTNDARWYNFQPKGINPENGQPADMLWMTEDRISFASKYDVPEPDNIPYEILGTEVRDTASGFKGIVTSITLHISGCVHANVQPKGMNKKTNQIITSCDFDVRRLEGKFIKKMTPKKREEDQRVRPSPMVTKGFMPR